MSLQKNSAIYFRSVKIMKKYIDPQIELISMSAADVITSSEDDWTGEWDFDF